MQDLVAKYLKKFRRERRMRRRLGSVLVALALVVSLGVYWQLKLTGAALTNETFCGLEEHQHDEDCYAWVLVCGYDDVTETTVTLEELEALREAGESGTAASAAVPETTAAASETDAEVISGHTHTAECYQTVTTLVCGQPESEGHTHSESCYTTELTCGLEESEGHTHDESCYTTELTCGLTESEGHTHDASCYVTEEVLVCGLDETEALTETTDAAAGAGTGVATAADGDSDFAVISDTNGTESGHVHTAACYEKITVCGLTEHTHTAACLSDVTADVETAADWEATLPAHVSDDWAEAVVAIAQSQLAYTESTLNYVLDEDGETLRGYTRYGAWAGNEYGDWDAMFASFCLHYAGISTTDFPESTGAYAWAVKLENLDLYADASAYTPAAGDLVFSDSNADGKIDRVGIVISVDAENDSLTVIEGDCATEDGADAVCEVVYGLSDEAVIGYGVLPEKDSNVEVYTASADGVTVTVTAPIGALPEGAQLSVSLMEEGSEAYHAAAEAIGYEEETVEAAVSESEDGIALASEEDAETETVVTSGLAVLDISFTLDGVEVEPTEAVTVSIDASAIIPEEADASTIEVQHLTETEDGVVEPTLVADATAETNGTVTVLVEDETTTAVVEFEVESFSSFTIQWSNTNSSGWQQQTYTAEMKATAYLSGTTEEIDGASGTISATSENAVSLTRGNSDLAIDGYELESATINYNGESCEATAVTVTVKRSSSEGSSRPPESGSETTTYTCTYVDGSETTQTLYSNESSQNATISLYYKTVPTVKITAKKTDTGYILTATPSNFTDEENITYTWTNSNETGATLVDNEDGTATLTWTGNWSESTSNNTDSGSTGVSTTISVTASSSYTNEAGDETVTETASDSLTASSVYVRVYVYVAAKDDNGNVFSDEMLALLGIDKSTIDANSYFPAGEIQLNVSFLSGKNYTTEGAALITSAGDWTNLLAALSEMDSSGLINMTGITVDNSDYAIDYSPNANNNVGDYISMAAQDVGYTWGSQHSALFRWNMTTSYGFVDQSVRYHLDLRFSTNKITFITGNNGIESGSAVDGKVIDSRVYITGSTIQDTENLVVPEGYKFAGYYTDAAFTTPWNGVGTPITEDVTVYIKLVPEDEMVLYYKVAQGEGTLSSYSEGVKESANPAEGSTATAADGYEFEGWYYDEDCTQKITDDVSGTTLTPTRPETGWVDGTTFYAKFVPIRYNITLQKVDSTNGTSALSGASFILSRTETTTDEDGNETTNITYYSYSESGEVNWGGIAGATPITTGANGTEVIHSLTTGYTYTLTETAAPDGYNLLTDSITFTVSGGIVTDVSCATSDVASVSDDGKTITVTNTPGYELPSAGGPGTALFTLLGLLLCGGAGLLLYRRRPG